MAATVARCTVTAVVILSLYTCSTIQTERRRNVTFSNIIEAALSLTCWRTHTVVTAKCIRTLTVVAKVFIWAFVDVGFATHTIKIFSTAALVAVLQIGACCIVLTRIRRACVACGIKEKNVSNCSRCERELLDNYYSYMHFFIVRGALQSELHPSVIINVRVPVALSES